MKVYQLFST